MVLGLVGNEQRWRKGENLDGNYIKDQNLSEISISGEVLVGLRIEKPKVYIEMKLSET